MAKLRILKNHVLFQFVDDIERVTEGVSTARVKETTEWGFVTSKELSGDNEPRWGKVTHVGPDVRDIAVGDEALIESLMWTNAMMVDGELYWGTDDSKILAAR